MAQNLEMPKTSLDKNKFEKIVGRGALGDSTLDVVVLVVALVVVGLWLRL